MSYWKEFWPSTKVILLLLAGMIFLLLVLVLIRAQVFSFNNPFVALFNRPSIEIPTPIPSSPSLTAKKRVKIYSGPDTDNEVYGQLKRGESAAVLGLSDDGSWWKIVVTSVDFDSGWVLSEFVDTQNVEGLVAGSADTASASDSAVSGNSTLTANTQLDLRSEPSSIAKIIGVLDEGQSAEIIGVNQDGTWWLIVDTAVETGQAWVPTELVTLGNTQAVPVVGSPEHIPSLRVASVTASVNVNVRSGPGTQYDKVDVLNSGQTTDAIGISPDGSWWLINAPSGIISRGWVSAKFVESENADQVPVVGPDGNPLGQEVLSASAATATANVNVNVRLGPGTEYKIIGLLEEGQGAEVIGRSPDGGWWVLKLPGVETGRGWVSGKFITVKNPEAVPVVQ
jgi:uncharacterized protein YraI